MGPLKPFENDDAELDAEIKIDHEFAKRYDYNKNREALQKYEELKRRGMASSSETDSDESSSEDGELMKPSKKKDSKFFDALIKVKMQDPLLADKDAKLFDSETESDADSGNERKGEEQTKKPMYLKDVVSKHLLEEGPEFGDEETDNDHPHGHGEKENEVKSYAEEQEDLRRQFFEADAQEGDDEEGDLFQVKNSGNMDVEDADDDHYFRDKLDKFFGEDDKLDAENLFLKGYFRDRMWCDDGKGKDVEDFGLSDEEEYIEKQEDYEREYNFRFEENAGDRVMGHSRKVEGSVRKKDNARKSQRERKDERIALAEQERKEELKRLKNLKKKEINEKLEKIREVAGIESNKTVFLDEDDLEDEFDPEKYDKRMMEAFGDSYYNAEDADLRLGSDDDDDNELAKPDFDKEDELLGLPKNFDDLESSGQGFLSARERILKNIEDDGTLDDAEGSQDQGKRKRKRKPSEFEKVVREQLMEEYYKLDYEDTIGDLKTRFKYKPVKAKRYGLTPEMVLTMDDKDLNQYVSLKKLAPYQEKEWKVPRIQTLQLKKLLTEHGRKVGRNTKGIREATQAGDSAASQPNEPKSQGAATSRKSMRKRRQAELKLSRSRLMAYGRIPTKAKSKTPH